MQSIARYKAHTRQVLLLRHSGGYFVCDEYYPTDNGRIHILGDQCYGTFNVEEFAVEIKKAAFDVSSIVFQGDQWPTPVAGSKDRAAILAHFGLHD